LYGCETWFPSVRGEHRFRVFENRALRIFGRKREEVAGSWRRLHNEELHNLNAFLNVIRVIKPGRTRWAGHAGRMAEMRNAYKILVGRSEGERPLRRTRRR